MKTKIYYYWNTDSYSKKGGECEVTLAPRDLTKSYYVNDVLVQVLDVEIPECPTPTREQQVDGLMANLDEQEAQINAELFMKLKEINEKRQQLLCLTNEVSA